MRWLALAVACSAATPALAWPVNDRFDLKAGEEKFQRLTPDAWVEVESPSVVTAELFETGEVMLTGKAVGSTLVLVHAEDKVAVWRVVVHRGGPEPTSVPVSLEAPARKACREVKVEGRELTATIRDETCRLALLRWFESDQFLAKDLDLTFELGALQSQLKAIEAALAKVAPEVKAVYVGAGLRLTGRASAAQHRRVFWEVFKASVGRLALEDRIEESSEGKTP